MFRKELSEKLKEIGAIQYGDFTLRSGKHSNYYVDLKKASCMPELLEMMADAIVKKIPEKTEKIAGLELGSVPIAAVVSVKSRIPMIIVRKQRKEYGTGNQIEGELKIGENVLVIEDTTTTGGQIMRAVRAIRDAGGRVEKAIVVVDREEGAWEKLKEEGVELISIIKASEIIKGDGE